MSVKISQQKKPIPNTLRMSPATSIEVTSVTRDVTVAPSTTTTALAQVIGMRMIPPERMQSPGACRNLLYLGRRKDQ
jgi:hypothetical protein